MSSCTSCQRIAKTQVKRTVIMLNRTEISALIPGEMEAKINSSTAAPRWEELKIVVCIQCFNVKTVSGWHSLCERTLWCSQWHRSRWMRMRLDLILWNTEFEMSRFYFTVELQAKFVHVYYYLFTWNQLVLLTFRWVDFFLHMPLLR